MKEVIVSYQIIELSDNSTPSQIEQPTEKIIYRSERVLKNGMYDFERINEMVDKGLDAYEDWKAACEHDDRVEYDEGEWYCEDCGAEITQEVRQERAELME